MPYIVNGSNSLHTASHAGSAAVIAGKTIFSGYAAGSDGNR